MKRRSSRLVVIVAFFVLAGTGALAATLSLEEYRQQLRDLTAKIDSLRDHPEQAGAILLVIPDQVTVNSGSREITVSYRDLKNDLSSFPKADDKKRPALLAQMRSYCLELSAGVEAYSLPQELNAAHHKLADILAQREFHKVHGPTPRDAMLARLYRWLDRLLRKLFRKGSSTFNWSQIAVYILVGAALVLLAVWTIRRLRRPEEQSVREIIPFAPSARGWRTWLAEARSSALQQDWRNAIHLAYWAAISFLEESGSWRPDRARTPREYLRMLGPRRPQYSSLEALTHKFELVWYGHRSADKSDFQETLVQLESLGCR